MTSIGFRLDSLSEVRRNLFEFIALEITFKDAFLDTPPPAREVFVDFVAERIVGYVVSN